MTVFEEALENARAYLAAEHRALDICLDRGWLNRADVEFAVGQIRCYRQIIAALRARIREDSRKIEADDGS
jgi:hypothetical protein